MKTLFTLLFTLLFVYPWQESNQSQEQPLARGMYSYTGRFFSDNGTMSDQGMCSSFFANIYENKLVITKQPLGSPQFVDTTYPYVGRDENGYRVYKLNDSDRFLVDSDYNLQHVLSSATYNGNVITNTRYEIEKGDHTQECLEKMKSRLYDTPFYF